MLSSKGVEGGAQITQRLDAGADDEGDGTKGIPELEAVIALRGLDELGEPGAVLTPVELARVDDDSADGCAVAADPLGGRVNDNVGAVVNGSDEVAASAKGIIDLTPV